MVCCSYFLTNMFAVQAIEKEAGEESSQATSIIVPALAILALVVISAFVIRHFRKTEGKAAVQVHSKLNEDSQVTIFESPDKDSSSRTL